MKIFRVLAETEENQNLKYNYFVYLSVLFTKDEPKFREMINQLPSDIKENTKHFIQKVEEKGMEKGMEETKRKAVQNMLRKNAEISFICDVMDVSEDFVHSVREKM